MSTNEPRIMRSSVVQHRHGGFGVVPYRHSPLSNRTRPTDQTTRPPVQPYNPINDIRPQDIRTLISVNFQEEKPIYELVDPNREGNTQYTIKCNKNCHNCSYINNNPAIISNITRKCFIVKNSSVLNCEARNVIYLITCKKCGLQYVGQTKRAFKQRMWEHKNSIKKNTLNTLIVNHFNSNDHTIEDFSAQIIEVIGDNSKRTLIQAEDYWIKCLNSVFPLGMNNQIKGCGNVVDANDLSSFGGYNPYFSIPTCRIKRPSGKRKGKSKVLNLNFLDQANNYMHNADLRGLYVFLRSQSKRTLNHFKGLIDSTSLSNDLKLILQGYFTGYFTKNPNKQTTNFDRICIPFVNKTIQAIHLETIFKDRQLKRLSPVNIKQQRCIQIVYTYDNPLSLSITNYNKTLRTLRQQDVRDLVNTTCECNQSPFRDNYYGHIITGDLSIITNTQLRKYMVQGSTFRIPNNNDNHDIGKIIEEAINQYVVKLSARHNIPIDTFDAYKARFLYIARSRIYTNAHGHTEHAEVITKQVLSSINQLHNKFVITIADKAANNYVIICKKFYIESLCVELGINALGHTIGNQVYQYNDILSEDIISRHTRHSKALGINLEDKNKCLPLLYGIPKLHKQPHKFRYIAGASNSSLKPLSINLANILKFFKQHFINYCIQVKARTGKNVYWSINNSLDVANWIKANIDKIKYMVSADFSTLFTSLPHDVIKMALSSIINKCFNNASKDYIAIPNLNVNPFGRIYYYNGNNYDPNKVKVLHKTVILELIDYILDETWVSFAGYNFKQICGVPMGGNASPLIADLVLSHFEFQYAINTHTNHQRNNEVTFRYMDDLLAINIENFMDISKNIYPNSLPLEKTNTCQYECNYLDLHINIKDKRITVYDKTKDFNFPVVKYVSPESNLHDNVIYGVLYSQLVRTARICNKLEDFLNLSLEMLKIYRRRNADSAKIALRITRFVANYPGLLVKYGLYSKQDIHKAILKKLFLHL